MRQGKAWGYTTEIFRNAIVSVYHLEIKEGGYCSEHYHKYKYNQFYVLSGVLELTIWRNGKIPDVTVIEAGQLLGVQKMVAGSVGKIGSLYNVNLRMFDVETGRIENNVSKRYEGKIEGLLDFMGEICLACSLFRAAFLSSGLLFCCCHKIITFKERRNPSKSMPI